jgi:nitrate reductase gamma subunit
MKSGLLFSAWPYIAVSLLAVGLAVRYLLERRRMDVVKEEMAEARALFGGTRLWRASLLLLIAGHGAVLLLPQKLLAWNGSAGRLYALEALVLVAGLAALAGWTGILRHHLVRTNRSAITELSDSIFLALLLAGIFSGLLMAVLYRWSSSWGALILAPYIASLLRLDPAVNLVTQMPFLVRLHVFSTFAAIAVLPLTRQAAFFVFVLHGAFAIVARPMAATGRAAESWLRKHNPATWLWPEED